MIRAELDPTFMETKRNKLLWEVTSTKMKEKGYNRSAEQCKCKWKNLVTRYKGCETMEAEGVPQQFSFYSELQAIFGARMQRMLWIEGEGGSSKKKGTNISSDDDEENEDSDLVGTGEKWSNKKRKKVMGKSNNIVGSSGNLGNGSVNALKDILDEFVKHQTQTEMEWLKVSEAREQERRMRENEWKQRMEALENERTMMERRWREIEEQRRIRDEARAEKRDALITQLLNKLRREDRTI
ncbi:trihelix transcription factor GT-3b-like [Impatiens glandulifera]|uniref:trihelix transcription factor GT-3b-like n=1 Tax=Impatiens glandulifera TaxID=253017 RepID=UPI001FB12EC7|nr:trihelix transcription factor GT-3b-like [Impatiens glandulifera]